MYCHEYLTHSYPFFHPSQKVFDVLGPGLCIKKSRFYPAVILQQGQVDFFLSWQWHLWTCNVSGDGYQIRRHECNVLWSHVSQFHFPLDVWKGTVNTKTEQRWWCCQYRTVWKHQVFMGTCKQVFMSFMWAKSCNLTQNLCISPSHTTLLSDTKRAMND